MTNRLNFRIIGKAHGTWESDEGCGMEKLYFSERITEKLYALRQSDLAMLEGVGWAQKLPSGTSRQAATSR